MWLELYIEIVEFMILYYLELWKLLEIDTIYYLNSTRPTLSLFFLYSKFIFFFFKNTYSDKTKKNDTTTKTCEDKDAMMQNLKNTISHYLYLIEKGQDNEISTVQNKAIVYDHVFFVLLRSLNLREWLYLARYSGCYLYYAQCLTSGIQNLHVRILYNNNETI
jgi:hypothetical protein